MPIYEYKCSNGHVFDAMQKFSDEPLTECTECGAPAQRVLTPPAIHFKGSGFHNTDYGTKKSGAASSSDGGSSSSTDSKSADASSASGDSKPAAAPTSTD